MHLDRAISIKEEIKNKTSKSTTTYGKAIDVSVYRSL